MEWQIHRPTRRCAQSDRELKEGETYYSALLSEGAEYKRLDFAADAWSGPPEGTIAWWKSQIPTRESTRARLAPSEALLQFFEELTESGEQPDLVYVMALLMLRRKIMRLEDEKKDEQGEPTLVLYCGRNEQTYEIVQQSDLSDERLAEIRTELEQLLYGEATS